MTENWLPITEAPGYEVSDLGHVRSPSGRILSPGVNGPYGYLRVQLGRPRSRYVHRLVAEAFIAPVTGMDVDHINGDVSNNAVDNLQVVTHAENMRLRRDRTPACSRGHLYAEHGFLSKGGARCCRICCRIWDSKRPSGSRRQALAKARRSSC